MSAEDAGKAASYVLSRYWDSTFPVNVIAVAYELGVKIMCFANQNSLYRGAYYPEHPDNFNLPTILVNEKLDSYSRNYSIAHELGHFVLHGQEIFLDPILVDIRPKLKDLEADIFAINIMTPEIKFRKYVNSKKYTILALSDYFMVPVEIIVKRLEDLHLTVFSEDPKIPPEGKPLEF
jgi:Zn-dependent peptidase ImmA (M78 family)